jgi:multidrug efflux system outer membrane protein
MSDDLTKLLGSGSGTWTFAPQLVAPIFASGSLRANLKAAEVERDIAVAQYEKAIQEAFGDVGDALVLRRTLVEQRDAQQLLVEHLSEAYRLSDARYKAGIDGYLAVLVSQRSLLVAQHALVEVRLAEEANLVSLYKVLGGGA